MPDAVGIGPARPAQSGELAGGFRWGKDWGKKPHRFQPIST
jgi:hypothetical protein